MSPRRLKGITKGAQILEAVVWGFLRGFLDGAIKDAEGFLGDTGRQVIRKVKQRWHGRKQVLVHQLRKVSDKRTAKHKHLKAHHTALIDVRSCVDGASHPHLRGHVEGGSKHRPGGGFDGDLGTQIIGKPLGDAGIDPLDGGLFFVAHAKDVLRLDIAVDGLDLVERKKAEQTLLEKAQAFPKSRATLFEVRVEIDGLLQHLHRVEKTVYRVFPPIQQSDHTRIFRKHEHFDLALHPLDDLRRVCWPLGGSDQLERDGLCGVLVMGKIYGSHPATAKALFDQVPFRKQRSFERGRCFGHRTHPFLSQSLIWGNSPT